MKKNIAVIFGGKSTEHDISILTALQAMEHIDREKYNVYPIYITKQGKWFCDERFLKLSTFENFCEKGLKEVAVLPNENYLFVKSFGAFKKDKKIDCALLALHGKNGEDGSIQGLMELANIPYTSSGILASSLGMNKLAQKIYFEGLDLPLVPYFSLTKDEYKKLGEKIGNIDFSFPVVIKPNRQGSSIGICFCKDKKMLQYAIDFAFKLDDTVVIEKAVENLKEVNISAMKIDGEILLSETEQPISQNSILTFADKYIGSQGTKRKSGSVATKSCDNKMQKCKGSNQSGLQNLSRKIPADIDENQKRLIESYAFEIYEKMECGGVIRIDFIIDELTQSIYVNEVNTIPGSFAYYLWTKKGISFGQEL